MNENDAKSEASGVVGPPIPPEITRIRTAAMQLALTAAVVALVNAKFSLDAEKEKVLADHVLHLLDAEWAELMRRAGHLFQVAMRRQSRHLFETRCRAIGVAGAELAFPTAFGAP